MIRKLRQFERPCGETYFTGILCWNGNNRLHFMFDPVLKELYIFDWTEVSNEDTKRIHAYMCNTFHSGMEIQETYRVA